jgi:hypothetical protein
VSILRLKSLQLCFNPRLKSLQLRFNPLAPLKSLKSYCLSNVNISQTTIILNVEQTWKLGRAEHRYPSQEWRQMYHYKGARDSNAFFGSKPTEAELQDMIIQEINGRKLIVYTDITQKLMAEN